MKGILGKKVGMTSVFSDAGLRIPVSIVEVQPNVITNVLTKEKHGYDAIQLAAFDRREKTSTKPLVGHFKKAKTGAKRIVREIRGMKDSELGSKITTSIFKPGELVDVTGTSKGKGFQGNIKRHNQSIGPKSHGGGGGSKPVRQVGSIGDVVSNRVFKNMTMPGQMGNVKVTVQNLEVVLTDEKNNLLLIKGSIPGPNKGFVIIKSAVKGLPSKDAIKLVDVKEAYEKNHLLEEAKKFKVEVNTDMSLEEMKSIVDVAKAKLEDKKTSTANKKEEESTNEPKSEEPKKEKVKGDA